MNDTHFAYDDALTVTDPLGNVTVNTYDDLNRLLSTTATPSVGDDIVVSYAYDQVGNRTRQTDGRDCIVRFTYDGLNRLTGETVPSRTQDNRTRTFDDVGNLLSVTHAGGTWRDTAQTYDALNRVVSETSSGLTHTHTYDKANNRLTTTYDKTGRVLTRTYDPGNRLLTQEDVLSGEPTRLTVFAYDPQGNLLVKTLTDSSTENRTFDVRNRVTELHVKEPDGAATRLLQIYEYDLAGNLIALEESSAVGSLPTRVLTCAYDGTHRLIVEADQRGVDPAIVTNYTYDKADNRISREVFGGPEVGTTTYAIGNGGNGTGANQIASLTRPDTSVVAFTYDLTGARTSRTEDTRTDAYSYDVWNRLLTLDLQTPATPGDRGLYEYSYDARTRRVSREELSAPTVLSFQGGVSIQEYAASPGTNVGGLPSPTVEYVRGPDQGGGVGGILYSVRGGAASLAHSSARGDVLAKVDESTSAMTWQAQYEAFGRRPEETGTNVDRQRANSKDEDPTGLLNEGFRYRDLETGRFITRDPAGFVDGPNLYTYVEQNPWTKFDPEGLFWSALVTAGFAAYDTYQYASGKISGADYAGRMALNGAALLADAATGGMGGGVAVRTAAIAARAGKVGIAAVKMAVAVDKADMVVSTAQAAISTVDAVQEGDYKRAALSAVQVGLSAKSTRKQTEELADTMRPKDWSPTHSQNQKLTSQAEQSHHIVQDAAVKNQPDYSYGSAPTTKLEGGSHAKGSPHDIANKVQDNAPQGMRGNYGGERDVAYLAMRAAGQSRGTAKANLDRADRYFEGELNINRRTKTDMPK